jgi:hypothetical protein
MGIYLQASDIVRPSSQGNRKFGSNSAAERWINNVERKRLTILEDRPDIISAGFDMRDGPRNFYAGFVKRLGCFF